MSIKWQPPISSPIRSAIVREIRSTLSSLNNSVSFFLEDAVLYTGTVGDYTISDLSSEKNTGYLYTGRYAQFNGINDQIIFPPFKTELSAVPSKIVGKAKSSTNTYVPFKLNDLNLYGHFYKESALDNHQDKMVFDYADGDEKYVSFGNMPDATNATITFKCFFPNDSTSYRMFIGASDVGSDYVGSFDEDSTATQLSVGAGSPVIKIDGVTFSGTRGELFKSIVDGRIHDIELSSVNASTWSDISMGVYGGALESGTGMFWDVTIDKTGDGNIDHSYDGYGNTDNDWLDKTGSAHGIVVNNPLTVKELSETTSYPTDRTSDYWDEFTATIPQGFLDNTTIHCFDGDSYARKIPATQDWGDVVTYEFDLFISEFGDGYVSLIKPGTGAWTNNYAIDFRKGVCSGYWGGGYFGQDRWTVSNITTLVEGKLLECKVKLTHSTGEIEVTVDGMTVSVAVSAPIAASFTELTVFDDLFGTYNKHSGFIKNLRVNGSLVASFDTEDTNPLGVGGEIVGNELTVEQYLRNPTSYLVGTDETNFYTGALHDIRIQDVDGNNLHRIEKATAHYDEAGEGLNDIVSLDTVNDNHGIFEGCSGFAGEGINTEVRKLVGYDDGLILNGTSQFTAGDTHLTLFDNPESAWKVSGSFIPFDVVGTQRIFTQQLGSPNYTGVSIYLSGTQFKVEVIGIGVSDAIQVSANGYVVDSNTLYNYEVSYDGSKSASGIDIRINETGYSNSIVYDVLTSSDITTTAYPSVGCSDVPNSPEFYFNGIVPTTSVYDGGNNLVWKQSDGVANGSPLTVGQKRETILQSAGMNWNAYDYVSIADFTGWSVTRCSIETALDPDGSGTDVMKATVTTEGSVILSINPANITIGEDQTLSVELYFPSANTDLTRMAFRDAFDTTGLDINTGATIKDQWITLSGTQTPDNSTLRLQLISDTSEFAIGPSGIGDVVYLRNVHVRNENRNLLVAESDSDNLIDALGNSIEKPRVNKTVMNLFSSEEYVEIPDSDSLDLTNDFTFEAWVDAYGSVAGSTALIKKGSDVEYVKKVANQPDESAFIDFRPATGHVLTSVTPVPTGSCCWQIVQSVDSGTQIYIDNVQDRDMPSATGSITANSDPLIIAGSDTMHVQANRVKLYNSVLDNGQLTQNYLDGGGVIDVPTFGDAIFYTALDSSPAQDLAGNWGIARSVVLVENRFGDASSASNSSISGGNYQVVDAGLNPENEITVSLWVKSLSGSNFSKMIFAGYDGNTGANETFMISTSGAGYVGLAIRNSAGSAWYKAKSDALPTTGVWHHIVGVYNGSEVFLMVDGGKQSVPNTNYSGTLNQASQGIGIGAENNGGREWEGHIDDIMVWDRGLSEQEALDLYNIQKDKTSYETWKSDNY